MSHLTEIQKIRELTLAMADARSRGDHDTADALEDEIFELEEFLEEQEQYEYDTKHQKVWR